jgi:hypothetical protein
MPQSGSFHGIVPGVAVTPVSQITLPVTFGTQDNFCREAIQFEVADFLMAYNASFGQPALSKFMAILHYASLLLRMPGPCDIISMKGDNKQAFDCDRESCETADRLMASIEIQELKPALAESPPDPVMPKAKFSKMSIQPEDTLSKMILLSTEESSKVAHIGNSLDPK